MSKVIDLEDNALTCDFKGVTLIDFWACWSGPCRSLSPVFDELAQDFNGRAKIAKANVDDCMILSSQFFVRTLPVVFILLDGKTAVKLVGIKSKDEYAKEIDKLLEANCSSADEF